MPEHLRHSDTHQALMKKRARKGCREWQVLAVLLGLGSLWESEISHRSPP